jgi:membrane protease YdiL (CAAX protease family)
MGLGILVLTALYLALSLKYRNPVSPDALHITRKQAGLYLIVGLLLILPGWFFDSLFSYLTGRGWLPLGIVKSPPLILSILIVAVSEEVFFRGYLLGRLKSLGGHRWVRIILVCVVFMLYKVLIHCWEGWTLAAYLEFFAFGAFKMLFETFWVDWTGSIVTPIVIHIGWDLIMFQQYATLPYWAL